MVYIVRRSAINLPRADPRVSSPPLRHSLTTESSVAALGDAIREYPGYSPTLLRETPNGIGTALATLTAGTDPFCRLRVPEITEQWAATRAVGTAHHRRDPLPATPALAEPDHSAADLVGAD